MTAPKPPPREMWAVISDDRLSYVCFFKTTCEALIRSDYKSKVAWEKAKSAGRVRIVRVRVEVVDD